MAVRIINLIKGLVTLGDPVNDTLLGETSKEYPFVEYDKIYNDNRFRRLEIDGIIQIINLDAGAAPFYDSIWSGPDRFRLDKDHFWVDSSGLLRIKVGGDATFDTDGSVVGGAANEVRITGLNTAAMITYQAAYVSGNNVVSPTDASSATGTSISATFVGVYDGTAGTVLNCGKAEVQFDAALAPLPGQLAFLSIINAGQFSNSPPPAGSGSWSTKVGIIVDNTNYAFVQRCVIVLQPERTVFRP